MPGGICNTDVRVAQTVEHFRNEYQHAEDRLDIIRIGYTACINADKRNYQQYRTRKQHKCYEADGKFVQIKSARCPLLVVLRRYVAYRRYDR